MAQKKPQKGTLNWCVKQAAAYGVNLYGRVLQKGYAKGAEKCCKKNFGD